MTLNSSKLLPVWMLLAFVVSIAKGAVTEISTQSNYFVCGDKDVTKSAGITDGRKVFEFEAGHIEILSEVA